VVTLELLLKRVWPEQLSVQSGVPLVVIKEFTGGVGQADANPAQDAPLRLEADNAPQEPALKRVFVLSEAP